MKFNFPWVSALVPIQTWVLNWRISFQKCWYFNEYFQNFQKIHSKWRNPGNFKNEQLPKQEHILSFIFCHYQLLKSTRPQFPARLCFHEHVKKCVIFFKIQNFFHKLVSSAIFKLNSSRRRKSKTLIRCVDCSTSSRRKPGWRFTAGSTYRIAVFLKRPAPAKIYDIGREYFNLNDTLHFVTSSVTFKVFKLYWSLIFPEYRLWCQFKLEFWTGVPLFKNVDIFVKNLQNFHEISSKLRCLGNFKNA